MDGLNETLESYKSQCRDIFKVIHVLSLNYERDLKKFENVFNAFIKSLPKNCKETELYKNVEKLKNLKPIRLEDIEWLERECCGNNTTNELQDQIYLEKNKNECDLYNYMNYIVNELQISDREKTVLLLAHFEMLLFYAFDIHKNKGSKIINEAKNKIAEAKEITINNIGLLLAIAITIVVFASTENFGDNNSIDQRLPFRHHILHNGIIGYNPNHIETLYKILLSFILKIMQIKNKFDKTK